jgi:single-strand selective monofunctional uracil DNA glycosylase
MSSIEQLIQIYDTLTSQLESLTDKILEPPVSYIYNPLIYAKAMHNQYLLTYGTIPLRVLFLGMNPGPDGMGQTGIPFGAVESVKHYLKLNEPIGTFDGEHPKKPVLGLNTTKNEPSGARLWGLFANRYPDPRDFFANHLVLNYCPLLFLNERGANVPTAALNKQIRNTLEAVCDQALKAIIQILEPQMCIGVGVYATQAINRVLPIESSLQQPGVIQILHPSPASPLANRGWAEQVTKTLVDNQVWQ